MTVQRVALARLAAAAFAAVLLLGPGASPAQGPFPGDDDSITAAVQRALWTASSLVHADIQVETAEGTVTLRGFATTLEDIANAGRLTLGVRGVRAVRNAIRVAARPLRA